MQCMIGKYDMSKKKFTAESKSKLYTSNWHATEDVKRIISPEIDIW
jgi:hypothetical protein